MSRRQRAVNIRNINRIGQIIRRSIVEAKICSCRCIANKFWKTFWIPSLILIVAAAWEITTKNNRQWRLHQTLDDHPTEKTATWWKRTRWASIAESIRISSRTAETSTTSPRTSWNYSSAATPSFQNSRALRSKWSRFCQSIRRVHTLQIRTKTIIISASSQPWRRHIRMIAIRWVGRRIGEWFLSAPIPTVAPRRRRHCLGSLRLQRRWCRINY